LILGEGGAINTHVPGKTYTRDFYSKKIGGKVLRRSRFYEKLGFQELYLIQEIARYGERGAEIP